MSYDQERWATDSIGSDPVDNKSAAAAITNEPWSDEIHRDFVSAIYDVGMKHSSPSVIYERMNKPPPAITTERIKSHLQKYRASREKSKEEFMQSYQSWLDVSKNLPPEVVMEITRHNDLSCGEGAAFLSYCEMLEERHASSTNAARSADVPDLTGRGAVLKFPQLTPQEEASPIGECMQHTMELMSSLTKQLSRERARAQSQSTGNPDSHPAEPTYQWWNDAKMTREYDEKHSKPSQRELSSKS